MSQLAEVQSRPQRYALPCSSHGYEDSPSLRHYALSCPACGLTSEDDGYMLQCPTCRAPALLKAHYDATELTIAAEEPGIFRYRDWLPVRRSLATPGLTVTYRSEQLSRATGLENLWIAFNGFWPERNAHLETGTFKELEAYCVLGRLPANNQKTMVVASAGNTAAAFAQACSANGTRCLLVVPESALAHLRFSRAISSCVKVVAVTGGADYSDAIRLAERAAHIPGFFAEGGAKNVARRDGLGTVLLNAFERLRRLPDYYFQAVGSGTGAIAVHEMARRLTGGIGPFPRLWLSQNVPFAPIYDAWRSRTRRMPSLSETEAKSRIRQIGAKVLANRFPPYAVQGGLYEALVQSQGTVLAVTNGQAVQAAEIFEASEGIDLAPAAAIAFASLLRSAKEKRIHPRSTVLLNVTGGGQHRRFFNSSSIALPADLSIASTEIESSRSLENIAMLF